MKRNYNNNSIEREEKEAFDFLTEIKRMIDNYSKIKFYGSKIEENKNIFRKDIIYKLSSYYISNSRINFKRKYIKNNN